MASAIHNATRQLGQTFGVAVLGTIILARAGTDAKSGDLTETVARAWVVGLTPVLARARRRARVLAAGVIVALVPRLAAGRA